MFQGQDLLTDVHNCVFRNPGKGQALFRPGHRNAYTEVLLKQSLVGEALGVIATSPGWCASFGVCFWKFRLEVFLQSDLKLSSRLQTIWNEIRKDRASRALLHQK